MRAAWELDGVHIALFSHSLWNHPFLNALMVITSKYALAVSIATFALAIVRRRQVVGLLPWAAMGGAIAVGLDLIGGCVFVHPRPFVALHVAPLFAHPADNSFPSDHSAVAAFLATTLWFVDTPAAAAATAIALAVGIARVYCLVHWPIDIVGGWVVGALPAIAASLLWRARNGSLAHHDRVRAGRI